MTFNNRIFVALVMSGVLVGPATGQRQDLAPTNVSVVAQGQSAVVSWSAVPAREVRYRVLRALNPKERGLDRTDLIAAISFQDEKLESGATYFYQVVAVYGDGSEYSAEPVGFTVPSAVTVPQALGVRPVGRVPAPGNPAVVGTPSVATVSWAPSADAGGYVVERWSQLNPSCCRATSPVLAAGTVSWADSNFPLEGGYTFRITALYANNVQRSVDVSWIRPTPTDPADFKATYVGGTTVQLTWQAVPGVQRYLLSGPGGVPNAPVLGTSLSVAGVPSGPRSWTVASLYEPGGVFTKGVTTSTVVRALPPHAPAWLSKHDAGAAPDSYWTSDQLYVCQGSSYAGVGYSASGYWNGCGAHLTVVERIYQGLSPYSTIGPGSGPLAPPVAQASYWNTNDLGVARNSYCYTKGASAMCVSSSHLLAPPPPGTAATPWMPGNPAPGEVYFGLVSDQPAPWNAPLGYTAIISDPLGMRFLSFGGDLTQWSSYRPSWLTVSRLDSEGTKPTPQACLACHGGRWNPITKVVTGATMLPIDPSNLEFAPGTRAQNEEAIRKLNMIVLSRSPSPAVASYIKGLYNGAPQQPGMVANDNYIPPGWVQQPGFYRAVIKPYCASCHMPASSTIDLSSFASVQKNKTLIYNSVCVQRSMPHAEAPFRQFWTKDTGAIYLPGYFAAVLGYASCP
jgi:hypothetical protein